MLKLLDKYNAILSKKQEYSSDFIALWEGLLKSETTGPRHTNEQGLGMIILIACECSGIVRDAFLALGHDAMSADLKPTQRPGPHYQGDVRDVLYDRWDALIAHPVCKYMANSGNKHLYLRIEGKWAKENGKNEERWEKMKAGAEFFNLFDRADHIPLRCVENPIMNGHALGMVGRIATQFVQPHWFGDPFSKATGLWLTGFKPAMVRVLRQALSG